MKIYDIVNEHKKGVKAMKYNQKPHDPAKKFAKEKEKLAPIKPLEEGSKKDKDEHDEWYDRDGNPDPNGAYDAGGHYHLERDVDESMYSRERSYGYNPERDAERHWDAYQRGEQDFRNRERNAGLEDEDDPNFERNFRQQQIDRDRGPWYLKVNGKILKSQGQPKVFDWKRGANNYGLAILKNKPELQGKIMLTKKAEDDVAESATASATNSANTGVGAIYPNETPKQPKNKDGTAKNALDMQDTNLITGGSIKR